MFRVRTCIAVTSVAAAAMTAAATPVLAAAAPHPTPVTTHVGARLPALRQTVAQLGIGVPATPGRPTVSPRRASPRNAGPLIGELEADSTSDVANMVADTSNEVSMSAYWASVCRSGGVSVGLASCLAFAEVGQGLLYAEQLANTNLATAFAIESYADYWGYEELIAVVECLSGGPCDP